MSTVVLAAAGGIVALAYYAYTRPGVEVKAPVSGGTPTSGLVSPTLPPLGPQEVPAPTNTVQPPPACDYSIAHINKLREAAGLGILDPDATIITPTDSTPGVCAYEAKTTTKTTVTAPQQGHCEYLFIDGIWHEGCISKEACQTGSASINGSLFKMQTRWVAGAGSLGCSGPL